VETVSISPNLLEGEMGTNGHVPGANQLLDRWRETKDVAARDHLVADHLPLVRRLCQRFSHSGESLEDLFQVGAIGLLKAIDKYNPQRGDNFVAFAIPVIVGEIKNYFRDHGWAVKLPRKLQTRKLAVDRTVGSLTQGLGRAPTIPEIAEATGFSEEEVYETFEVGRYGKPLSLDAEYEGDGGEETSSILDCLGSVDPELEGLANKVDLKAALGCLNSREEAIIYLRFYADLPQTEIAKRLGISQMHVSRLQRNALSKLKLNLMKEAAD